MPDPEIKIEFHSLYIDVFKDDVFTVAKLKRISSSPVWVGAVPDAKASALERLTDIFRCGKESRNYVDFQDIKAHSTAFGPLDAETEWIAYTEELCRVREIQELKLFQLRTPTRTNRTAPSGLRVKYRPGTMIENPYMIACVGSIMASPTPIWLTDPHVRGSALARLYDVFRIGTQGRIYKDFHDYGIKAGRNHEELQVEWDDCEAAVIQEIQYGKSTGPVPNEVLAEWDACERGVMRARELAEYLASQLFKDDQRKD